jgi:TRAP transporter TAXI family solute receptor
MMTNNVLPHFGTGSRVQPQILCYALSILLALLVAVASGPFATAQTVAVQDRTRTIAGPERAAAVAPQRLEEQWKTKLNANTLAIIAGSPEETSLDIAHDLAVVLNDDDLRVLPIVGLGGAQNIRDVLYLRGVDVGVTSTQMLRYFASTGELTSALDQRLNYITRLYPEEMHVVAARDIKSLQDLAGKKVNFSETGSSTQITSRDVFGLLSVDVQEVNMNQADAIAAVKNGQIAATVFFSGKPSGVLARISASDNLHLLEVPYTRTLENVYLAAQLEQSLYPNLIENGQAIQTIAIDSVLITNNWQPASERYRRVAKFVDALFSHFPDLQKAPRHPKWKEVDLGKELPGWQRFPAAQDWLQQAKFEDFAAKRQPAGAAPTGSAEKQRLFREFLEWSQSEAKKQH